jgi:hypothetical protein
LSGYPRNEVHCHEARRLLSGILPIPDNRISESDGRSSNNVVDFEVLNTGIRLYYDTAMTHKVPREAGYEGLSVLVDCHIDS